MLKGNLAPGAIAAAPGQSNSSVAQAAAATPRRTRAQITTTKVNAIIDAILAFNNTPGRSQGEKWAISFPIVKELGKPIGATYQKVILQVLEARGAEIEDHHENHGLGRYHNRGKNLARIHQAIQVQVQGDWEMSA